MTSATTSAASAHAIARNRPRLPRSTIGKILMGLPSFRQYSRASIQARHHFGLPSEKVMPGAVRMFGAETLKKAFGRFV
jgi:hypothetical protein